MFSNRLRWDAATNPLAALLAEKRRAGAEVLDLTLSNPTRAEFEYPNAEILASLSRERSLTYDPQPRGLLEARHARRGTRSSDHFRRSIRRLCFSRPASHADRRAPRADVLAKWIVEVRGPAAVEARLDRRERAGLPSSAGTSGLGRRYLPLRLGPSAGRPSARPGGRMEG